MRWKLSEFRFLLVEYLLSDSTAVILQVSFACDCFWPIAVSGHQFDYPVDKHPHLGADMVNRREGQIHWHRRHVPVFKQRQQFAADQVRYGHVLRQSEHPEGSQVGGKARHGDRYRRDLVVRLRL